jgi:hypothetical protein
MYRAEVEVMPTNPPDRLPRTGLWKVVIYEAQRFVRTDKENLIISVAEKLAEELNYQFGHKKSRKEAYRMSVKLEISGLDTFKK